MKKIYEDILDDVGEIKRPSVPVTKYTQPPHPGEFEYAICNFVPEICLGNSYLDRIEALLDIYADDYSFNLAITEDDMNELIDYISESRPKYAESKQRAFNTNQEKGFALIEFNAPEKNLPMIFFYLFGLCIRTCYLLIPDPDEPSSYIIRSDNLGVSFAANKIITEKDAMLFERRSLSEQITYFIVKCNVAAKNYGQVKEQVRNFINRMILRLDGVRTKKEARQSLINRTSKTSA